MTTTANAATHRIAYLSLQAVAQGQDSWAAVLEVIRGMRDAGWIVDEWFATYPEDARPSPPARLREWLRVQRALVRHIADYDAVYMRGHVFGSYAAFAAHRHGIPIIRECHGSNEDIVIAWPSTRYIRPLLELMSRWHLRHADAVIAVTPQLARWVRKESGRADCDVSQNGANIEVFSPFADRRPGLPARYAAFFGQFAAWQGIGVILDAVKRPEWPEGLSLVVVGDGALRPDVEAAAASDNRIVYLGKLPYRDVAGVVAGAIASIVATYNLERAKTGFSPLKLYESLACGVPVVVSDTGGQAAVVKEERCGLVVKPGDPADLAKALGSLAADPDAAALMGARAREAAAERHSWAARARERMAITERTITAARSRKAQKRRKARRPPR